MDSGVVFSGIFGNCCSSPTSRRPTPYFSRLSLLHPKLSAHSTNADSPDPVGDWLANPATLQAAQKCGLFQAAAAKLKHVQPDERATSAPALPTMPPSREPPPRKTPTEHWGQAAVTLPRPIRRTTQPNREPPPRKTPTERCGQAAVTLPRPTRRTTQAAEPEQLRIPPPKCEGSAASAHTQRAADAEHRG